MSNFGRYIFINWGLLGVVYMVDYSAFPVIAYVQEVGECPPAELMADALAAVMFIDDDYTVLRINHLAATHMGFSDASAQAPDGPIGMNIIDAFDEIDDSLYPSCAKKGKQIIIDLVERAKETRVYQAICYLVAPSGMLYEVIMSAWRLENNTAICCYTSDRVHQDWTGYTKMDRHNNVTNVRGYTHSQEELELIVAFVECDSDEEAADMLGISTRQLARRIERMCVKTNIKGGKMGLLRRLARPRIRDFPTEDNILPMLADRPIWDAIRLETIPHETLPPLGAYQFTLKELIREMGAPRPAADIQTHRDNAGHLMSASRKLRIDRQAERADQIKSRVKPTS